LRVSSRRAALIYRRAAFVDWRSPPSRSGIIAPSKQAFEGAKMQRLDLKFLLLGAIMLSAGVTLGIVMGMRQDFALAPVHAHINLVGWASLALFGIVYKLYPELARSRLAALHFILAAPAAILFPLGIALSILYDRPLVAVAAAFLWLAGVLLFLAQLVALAFRAAPAAAE
jgi:uncharacterized membrane protein YgdD (TMEM256/DUF423 family)